MADRACLLAATLLLAVFGLFAWFTGQLGVALFCLVAGVVTAVLSVLLEDNRRG